MLDVGYCTNLLSRKVQFLYTQINSVYVFFIGTGKHCVKQKLAIALLPVLLTYKH